MAALVFFTGNVSRSGAATLGNIIVDPSAVFSNKLIVKINQIS